MEAAGWMDANNHRGRIKVGDFDIEIAGVHDSHIARDRYDDIAGPADQTADPRLGALHSPVPWVMDRYVADGSALLPTAHTHSRRVGPPEYTTRLTTVD